MDKKELKDIREWFVNKNMNMMACTIDEAIDHITALEERVREFENIRQDILNFAKTMQYKMDKNKNKPHKLMNSNGDNRTYSQLSLATLYDLMCGEIAELKDALLEYEHFGASQNSVRYECADVANFAMMIHENIINNQGE